MSSAHCVIRQPAPRSVAIEQLEPRRLFAASPVYAPHANVRGETLQQYAADWWKSILATPIYAADGKTIINPQFDAPLAPGDTVAANYAFPSQNGKVIFLGGSFFGSEINRTVTVPTGTPIFVPVVNTEWSNADTADGPAFDTWPGHYTQQQLKDYAVVQANLITGLTASLDGQAITDIGAHREPSLNFTYTEPAQFGVHNVFFGESITTPEFAAADGYYIMLKPLSPGKHVLRFGGSIPHSDPPLLDAFTADVTYTINVVPKGQFQKAAPAVTHGNSSVFSSTKVKQDRFAGVLD